MADILAPLTPSDELLDVLVSDSLDREGFVPHMYLDVKGLVTVGVGHLLRTPQDALAPPFMMGGRPATLAEVRADYLRVAAMPKAKLAEEYGVPGAPAVTREWALSDCRNRTRNEFLPGIWRLLPELYGYPLPAVRALAGMAYAMGVGGLAKFHRLLYACARRDWATAARECAMEGASSRTNVLHKSWFEAAASSSAK